MRQSTWGTQVGDEQTQVRRMVGLRLRQMRLHRNLKQETAARAIGASIAKVSRMEHGLTPFRRDDMLALLHLYGVTDPAQAEVLTSIAVGGRSPAWWSDDVPLEDTVVWANEQAADLIRSWQPFAIPELLRTEAYAHEVLLARHYPEPASAATKTAVANLLRRQRARRARLWAIVDEPVLWRPIAGDLDTHLRQLDALEHAARAGDVTIQIVPWHARFLAAAEPFTLYRTPGRHICTARRHTGDHDDNPDAYGVLFDQLAGVAHPPADTPHVINRIRDHLHAHGGYL